MGSSDERTAPSTTVPTPAEETRSAKIADLIKASKLYHQVEQVKEAVYENEGSFPGKEASLVCPACRSDDSVGPKEKSRRYACKRGLNNHLHGPFHSPYSRWRRLRKQEAQQFAALAQDAAPRPHGAVALANAIAPVVKLNGKPLETPAVAVKLRYYCPYPFCSAGSAGDAVGESEGDGGDERGSSGIIGRGNASGSGWSSIHELVAHVQASDTESESLVHEHAKWADGWADCTWLRNEEAELMIREVERLYSV